MNFLSLLPCVAGVGLFLFGMNILGSSLERMAGSKMQALLEKLTSSRIKGMLLGTGVTGVIQSSSATTIMAIGLLNAGVFKLYQAMPVIMGANIGTTVTAQILRLGDLSSANILLSLLKPSSFGPVLIGIGAILTVFFRSRKKKDLGLILLGLGMIFFGMNTMETAFSPLKEEAWFISAFTAFSNPVFGVLLGAGLTGLLQSSSASVGILQAISSTGVITFSSAVPIILGQNIGKCITVILASFGSKRDAKRAVFLDVMFNLIGVIAFFAIIFGYQHFVGFSYWNMSMTRGNIADFHTLFNVVTSVALLPFVHKFIGIAKKAIPDSEASQGEQELERLDDILLLKTPNMAVEQCHRTVIYMSNMAYENFGLAMNLFKDFNETKIKLIEENEDIMDRFETSIGNYVIKINALDLSDNDNRRTNEILHTVGDLERIGDYAMNICEVASYNKENDILFTESAMEELDLMSSAVKEILELTLETYKNGTLSAALKVEPLEQVIDRLQEELKSKHIERLKEGQCGVQGGISFLEIINNLERISDHCSNIALSVIQLMDKKYGEFNSHDVQSRMHNNPTDEYTKDYAEYMEKYKIKR